MTLQELHDRCQKGNVLSLTIVYRPARNRWCAQIVTADTPRPVVIERDSPTLSAAVEQAALALESRG